MFYWHSFETAEQAPWWDTVVGSDEEFDPKFSAWSLGQASKAV